MAAAEVKVSVVIATLGGPSLAGTIDRLNSGSLAPAQILICIPSAEAAKAAGFAATNVELVVTQCRGQVGQRAEGFARAKHEYVLQIDDDMLVEHDCLQELVATSDALGERVSVAASLICVDTGASFYRAPQARRLLQVYYWLLNGKNGYVPGSITRAGTNVGVDPQAVMADRLEVEWVPGGCVMHRKAHVILDNFFPFKGKAYCEDLYHSYRLRHSGVRMFVSFRARCLLDPAPSLASMKLPAFLQYLRADMRARSHLVRLDARSMSRMYCYYGVLFCRYLAGRFRSGATSKAVA